MSKRKKLPTFLTEQEQNQLLAVFNERYVTSYRNKVMCLLFLKTGLRLSEMINLKWKDIDILSGRLTVINGKGSKDRILYISDETINKLVLWKERQCSAWGKSPYVFSNRKCNQLISRDVREMINTYSQKAGIDKKVSPHSLRHSFATERLRKSKNIRMVQKALGHSDLSTTMIYSHIIDDDFEQALKAL